VVRYSKSGEAWKLGLSILPSLRTCRNYFPFATKIGSLAFHIVLIRGLISWKRHRLLIRHFHHEVIIQPCSYFMSTKPNRRPPSYQAWCPRNINDSGPRVYLLFDSLGLDNWSRCVEISVPLREINWNEIVPNSMKWIVILTSIPLSPAACEIRKIPSSKHDL
jgi:hypothetical protein